MLLIYFYFMPRCYYEHMIIMVSRFYVQKVVVNTWDYNFDILFVIVIGYKRRWSLLNRLD
jgi:hypothetical protein